MSDCPTPEQLDSFLSSPADAEVERHIQGCASCQTRMEEFRDNQAMFEKLRAHDGTRTTTAGFPTVDGYSVESLLYQGGQGIVYKAQQLATHRTVAIKVLLEGVFASPARHKRFEREIELVSALRHPNIVTIHDSGFTTDGQHYLVMEYVRGVPLHQFLAADSPTSSAARPSMRDCLRLFAKICAAVNFAHQRGVIHRDLKPGNILVDTAGEPRIIDFGLAKVALDDHPGSSSPLTTSGEFMGTLAFASPEQVGADPDLVDLRTDVYSLGVILYHLLTGQSPYPAHTSVADLVRAISEVEPKAPSAVPGFGTPPTAQDLPASGNADLDAITLRALAKDRERRYQSAGELARDIHNFLAGRPVDARRDSTAYVVRKLLARHRPLVMLGAALLVVIIGATVVSIRGWQNTNTQHARALREATKAQEYGAFLTDLFASVDPDVAQGQDVTVRDLLDTTALRLETSPPEDPGVEFALRHMIADSYIALGFSSRSEPHLRRALDLAEDLPEVDRAEVLQVQLCLTDCLRFLGDFEEAQAQLQGVETAIDDDAERFKAEAAIAARARADIAIEQDQPEAAALARRAEELIIQAFGPQCKELVALLATHGEAFARQGQVEVAQELLERSLEILRETSRTGTARHSAVLRHLADVAKRRGDAGKSLELLEQAYKILMRLVGPEHPRTLLCACQMEVTARTHGLALDPSIEESVRQARSGLRPTADEAVAHMWNDLALLAELDGNLAEAETCFRNALESYRLLPGGHQRARGVIEGNLFWVLFRQGFKEQALRLGFKAHESLRSTVGSPAELVAIVANLVWILLDAGDLDQAREIAQDTLRRAREGLPSDHWRLGEALSTLGLVLHKQGECDAAEELLREACGILDTERLGLKPACLYAQHRLAFCIASRGQAEEADALYVELADLYARSGGVAAWEHPQVLLDLGHMRQKEEWFEEALEAFRDAVDHARARGAAASTQLITGLNSAAQVHRLLDQPQESSILLRDAVLQGRLLLAPGDPQRLRSLYDLRDHLEQEDEWEQVLAIQEELHSCLRQSAGARATSTLREARQLQSLYEELGRDQEAERLRAVISGSD